MDLKDVAVLIPSYKRPDVLKLTLESLIKNSIPDTSGPIRRKLGIYVALNEACAEDAAVVATFSGICKNNHIDYKWVSYPHNRGKANALNDMFKAWCGKYKKIVCLDNDMVIKSRWLKYVDMADKVDYELMGFSSAHFWAHLPSRDKCPFEIVDGWRFYKPYNGVAGGMMLFPRHVLENHKWTNEGGVYGKDDANMCLVLKRKYVLHSDEDWLDHDPLGSSTPELKRYHNKKNEHFRRGEYVLKKGWDK